MSAGETGPIAPSSEASVSIKVDSSFHGSKIWFTTTQPAMQEIESTRVRVELVVSSKDADLEIRNLKPIQETIRVSKSETSLGVAMLKDIIKYPGLRAIVITNVNSAGVLRIRIKNLSTKETIPSFEIRILKNVHPL